MFASPSPKHSLVIRSSSQGALENSQSPNRSNDTRRKIQEKLIRNYMAKYKLSHPDEKILNEVNRFFSKPNLNHNDLKALDVNVANILTTVQSPLQNNPDNLSINRSNPIINENKILNDIVKLPTILSNHSRRRDEMSESKATGMSGCSELSNKYDLPNHKKLQLDHLLKEYNIRKEQGSSLENIKTNDNLITNDNRRDQKFELKRQLDSQVQEKIKRKENLQRSLKELDTKLLNSISNVDNTDKEKEIYRRKRNFEEKQAMDHIIKQQKKRIALQEKKEKELDEETSK
jgi:hypothetical protein